MTELKVDNITNLAGSGKPNLPVAPTVGSNAAISTLNTHSYTSSGTEPSSPKNGALWWDSTNDKVFVYINSEFKEIELNASSSSGVAWGGNRGIVAGGEPSSGTKYNTLQYFDITSAGNATDFGDMTSGAYDGCAVSSGARGVNHHGLPTGSSAGVNSLDYFAPATAGNASDFGDRTVTGYNTVSVSSGTRGVFMGGYVSSGFSNVMDYITIDSTGNATDFGDLTTGANGASATNNETRGVRVGGFASSNTFQNVMDYITIGTAGNATDFGDTLPSGIYNGTVGNISDNSRGIVGNGYGDSSGWSERNVLQYITIDTAGNATDFGDTLTTLRGPSACSNGTTGTIMAGYTGSAYVNTIQSITIGTAGNAVDFGDIIQATAYGTHGLSGAAS